MAPTSLTGPTVPCPPRAWLGVAEIGLAAWHPASHLRAVLLHQHADLRIKHQAPPAGRPLTVTRLRWTSTLDPAVSAVGLDGLSVPAVPKPLPRWALEAHGVISASSSMPVNVSRCNGPCTAVICHSPSLTPTPALCCARSPCGRLHDISNRAQDVVGLDESGNRA